MKEVIPEVGESFGLDINVVNLFPTDCKVIEAISYGTAAWTRASRITIETPDGNQKSYFLKVHGMTLSQPAQRLRLLMNNRSVRRRRREGR